MDCYWAGIGITTQQEQAGLDGNYSARRTLLAKIFVNIAHTEILWQSLEIGSHNFIMIRVCCRPPKNSRFRKGAKWYQLFCLQHGLREQTFLLKLSHSTQAHFKPHQYSKTVSLHPTPTKNNVKQNLQEQRSP